MMAILKCSCDALFLLLSSAAPLCSLLRVETYRLSLICNHPHSLIPSLYCCWAIYQWARTYVTCLTACFDLVSCAFGQTDSCQLSVTFIACTLFWACFALLQPNVSDSVPPSPSTLLSSVRLVVWPLPAASCCCFAFLVSAWLQLKPSAVFNCHCHVGLFGLGNATFGHLQAKCLTKHNLQITQCGNAA